MRELENGVDDPLGFRVEPKMKAAPERAAVADRRSFSSLVGKVPNEWLRHNGHLDTKTAAADG